MAAPSAPRTLHVGAKFQEKTTWFDILETATVREFMVLFTGIRGITDDISPFRLVHCGQQLSAWEWPLSRYIAYEPDGYKTTDIIYLLRPPSPLYDILSDALGAQKLIAPYLDEWSKRGSFGSRCTQTYRKLHDLRNLFFCLGIYVPDASREQRQYAITRACVRERELLHALPKLKMPRGVPGGTLSDTSRLNELTKFMRRLSECPE